MNSLELPPSAVPDGPIGNYRTLALYAGLAFAAVMAASLLAYALLSTSAFRAVGRPARLVLVQLAGYAGAVAVLALLTSMQGVRLRDALRWGLPSGAGAMSVASGLVISIGTVLISALIRTPSMDNPMQDLMNEDPITMGLAAVTMAPVCEEIFFRGVLQPLLVRDMGFLGIFFAALPFALLHGPEYKWSWAHISLIFLAGSSFGVVRHRLRSTSAAVITHATYNGMLMVFYILGRALV